MRDRHVRVVGPQIRFQFRGKSGKTHAITLEDRRLAAIVKRSRDLPGYELFQYVDERGVRRTIESADVNAYLREIAGEPFTAKDFRTWAGTVLAARALQEARRADSKAAAKRHVLNAIESVAARLGNTKAICRKCYIHPAIIEGYLDGSLLSQLQRRVGKELRSRRESLPPDEAAVLRFLQRGLKRRRRSTDNRDHASVSTLLRRSLKQVRSKEGGVGRRVRSKG
jgi:DNA topoisomerase-1